MCVKNGTEMCASHCESHSNQTLVAHLMMHSLETKEMSGNSLVRDDFVVTQMPKSEYFANKGMIMLQ